MIRTKQQLEFQNDDLVNTALFHPRHIQLLLVKPGTSAIYSCLGDGGNLKHYTIPAPPLSVAWSPTGDRFAATARTGFYLYKNLGPPKKPLVIAEGEFGVVEWNPGGTELVSQPAGRTLRLYKDTGDPEHFLRGHNKGISSLAWNPKLPLLASGGDDSTIRLLNLKGTTDDSTVESHSWTVTGLAWSTDGEQLISSCKDGTLKLWNPKGTLIETFSIPWEEFKGVAWHPDGRRFAAAGSQNTLSLWNAQSHQLEWIAVMIYNALPAVFSSAGELLHGDPDVVEQELIYWIETEDDKFELLKPSEFQRVWPSGGKPE